MLRTLLPVLVLLGASQLHAQDFVAVKVEAENFVSKHSDWRVTSNGNTPNVRPDPDGSHASSASGRSYVELLPDTRVTHGDRLVSGGNFWNTGGTGPSLTYNVNIPEAGRYLVWVKAYSTGTEDNGIHVGVNNTNPASGQRMQWCSGKNKWTWSSAQRTSSNHCGVPRTIFLDFSFAGANRVTFSAREDGFEFDQFILLKTNNNSCTPNDNDQIVCNNGTSNVPAQNPTPAPAPEPEPQPAPQPTPEPTPVAVETPEPIATPVQTASSPATLPTCSSSAVDPDGDGYGWENNQSCVVSGQPIPATAQANPGVTPVCQSANSDPDGDGYGWEQGQSCVVAGTANAAPGAMIPACSSDSFDPDGDGWGWENSQSCLVQ